MLLREPAVHSAGSVVSIHLDVLMRNASWKEDGSLERAMRPPGRRTGAPEAGWRLQPKPGGPGHQDVGSGRKTTLQIEAERPRSQDAGPGKKDEGAGRQKSGRPRKTNAREAKKRPGRQSSRPDRKKTGGTMKTATGNRRIRFCASAGGDVVLRRRRRALRPAGAIPRPAGIERTPSR